MISKVFVSNQISTLASYYLGLMPGWLLRKSKFPNLGENAKFASLTYLIASSRHANQKQQKNSKMFNVFDYNCASYCNTWDTLLKDDTNIRIERI